MHSTKATGENCIRLTVGKSNKLGPIPSVTQKKECARDEQIDAMKNHKTILQQKQYAVIIGSADDESLKAWHGKARLHRLTSVLS